jgi:hypothetical protein
MFELTHKKAALPEQLSVSTRFYEHFFSFSILFYPIIGLIKGLVQVQQFAMAANSLF